MIFIIVFYDCICNIKMSYDTDLNMKYALYKLPLNDLLQILLCTTLNKVKDMFVTEVHLCVFNKLCGKSIRQKEWPVEVKELRFLKIWLGLLNDKKVLMNKKHFINNLFDEYMIIPIQFIWLLQKADILYIDYYCCKREPVDIPEQLLNIIRNNVDEEDNFFNSKTIVHDILIEFLLCNYVDPYSNLVSKNWKRISKGILFDLFDKSTNSESNYEPRLTYHLQNLHLSSQLCPFILYSFYTDILERLILNKTKYSIYDAYTNQEAFTSKNISKNLLEIFSLLFTKCKLSFLQELCTSSEEDIVNWKYFLTAIAVCVANIEDGPDQLNAIIEENLIIAFNKGNMKNFIKAILFARQGCYEGRPPLHSYSDWYSKMFGRNSNFRTARNKSSFLFLMDCLTRLVPHEPLHILKIHIDKSLRVPPMCQKVMLDYKNYCRSHLNKNHSVIACYESDNDAFELK